MPLCAEKRQTEVAWYVERDKTILNNLKTFGLDNRCQISHSMEKHHWVKRLTHTSIHRASQNSKTEELIYLPQNLFSIGL